MTVLALPQSEEVLVERIGLQGAQAMLTVVKVNPDSQFRPGRCPTADAVRGRHGRVK